jgi:hypothetical protein
VHRARHDLGEDVGFGEALGADIDDRLGKAQRGQQKEPERAQRDALHPPQYG